MFQEKLIMLQRLNKHKTNRKILINSSFSSIFNVPNTQRRSIYPR